MHHRSHRRRYTSSGVLVLTRYTCNSNAECCRHPPNATLRSATCRVSGASAQVVGLRTSNRATPIVPVPPERTQSYLLNPREFVRPRCLSRRSMKDSDAVDAALEPGIMQRFRSSSRSLAIAGKQIYSSVSIRCMFRYWPTHQLFQTRPPWSREGELGQDVSAEGRART